MIQFVFVFAILACLFGAMAWAADRDIRGRK